MSSETSSAARPPLNPWRTVLTVLLVSAMQLAGFLYGTHHGFTAESATAYGALCLWSAATATGQAAKGTLEQIANGTGLRGIKAALLTDAKPGEPAPPAQL